VKLLDSKNSEMASVKYQSDPFSAFVVHLGNNTQVFRSLEVSKTPVSNGFEEQFFATKPVLGLQEPRESISNLLEREYHRKCSPVVDVEFPLSDRIEKLRESYEHDSVFAETFDFFELEGDIIKDIDKFETFQGLEQRYRYQTKNIEVYIRNLAWFNTINEKERIVHERVGSYEFLKVILLSREIGRIGRCLDWEVQLNGLRKREENHPELKKWMNVMAEKQYLYHHDLYLELGEQIDKGWYTALDFLRDIGIHSNEGFFLYLRYKVLDLINTEEELLNYLQICRNCIEICEFYSSMKTQSNYERMALRYDLDQETFSICGSRYMGVFNHLSKPDYVSLTREVFDVDSFTDFKKKIAVFSGDGESEPTTFCFLKVVALRKIQIDNKTKWKDDSLLQRFQALKKLRSAEDVFNLLRGTDKPIHSLSVEKSHKFWREFNETPLIDSSEQLRNVTSMFFPFEINNFEQQLLKDREKDSSDFILAKFFIKKLRSIQLKPFPQKAML